MVRRTLNSQPRPQPKSHRENIFHTRHKISKNVCSLIIDSKSCCNCCSVRMVDKLKLELLPHPKPYINCIGLMIWEGGGTLMLRMK